MTCEELLTYLSSYLDHDLDDELTQAAREHLSTCQNCQVVLNTTERVIVLGRGQAGRTIPAERRQRLFDSLQAAFLNREPSGH
jgi:anti-sigma factor RsiW